MVDTENYKKEYPTIESAYGRIWFLEDKLEKLEKALDKACEELEEDGCCGYFNATELCNIPFSCRKCWKEFLLKESEKQ